MNKVLFIIMLMHTIHLAYGQKQGIKADTIPFFTTFKMEAHCESGDPAWKKYLERSFNNSVLDSCIRKPDSSFVFRVKVLFDVEKDGSISTITVKNKENLSPCLVSGISRIIRNGPKWVAAFENGVFFKSTVTQQFEWIPSNH